MKNDMHLAYRTTLNHPVHISSLDGVRAHLNDAVRLIAMLPAEWPKIRGRDIERKSYTVQNSYEVAGHTVQHVILTGGELEYSGRLVDGKYFFTDACLNHSMDLEMMFTPFASFGLKPMVRREWSWEYPSSNPFWYTLVDADTETYQGVEEYHHILGYESLGIHCLADLLAYSYKFSWDHETSQFVAITDPHEVTKRLRKPWMQYLIQWKFGEAPSTEADLSKLVSFLLTKVQLSKEEQAAVDAIRDRSVTLDDLKRINQRHVVLNKILDAYNDPFVLEPGCDFQKDPLFAIY